MYHGLFQQAGVIEASSVREMFDMAKALATQPTPRGGRVLVVTDSGAWAYKQSTRLRRRRCR
jgi:acyl-CoA synthetase (NDP forming)